ncbi:MAG TPA: hypothetical protein VM491_16465 [Burkholderiaceae bacterium]|jgi:hypothetical protein|nr:hypothetical protein [Burkholderiaceae bacterium]
MDDKLERCKRNVEQTYLRYLDAFMRSDLAAIDSLVRYPLALIGHGSVTLVDRFPFEPGALRAAKQWHTTVHVDYEVTGVSLTKAHVMLRRGDRVRADGSLIETVSAFYAFVRGEGDDWRIFAMSAIENPAS